MINKLAATSIVVILLLSAVTLAGKAFAQTTPTLLVNPPSVVDETLTPGKTLIETIEVANITNMYAYEFKLYYKNNVLNLTSAIRPPGNFLEPSDPANQFVAKSEIKNNFNATFGRAWFGFTLLFPEIARSGSGVLMQLTFNITGVDSTPLTLADSVLADDLGGQISHNLSNGFFSNLAAPPPPPPAYVFVDPATTNNPALTPSSNFALNISIINATDLSSFEFTLNYSSAILEVTATNEGTFLNSAGATTILKNQTDNTAGSVLFSVGLNAPPGVTGDGTLATISFKVLEVGTTSLTLSEIVLEDSTGATLTSKNAGGSFSNLTKKPGDINGDGKVDLLDLVAAAISFGATPSSPRWNPDADLDHNGIINVFDLIRIVLLFGT